MGVMNVFAMFIILLQGVRFSALMTDMSLCPHQSFPSQ